MQKTLYDKNSFTVSVWSGGTTTQLFILPEQGSYASRNFFARISSATVDSEHSEFTVLTGVRRFISPLDGKLVLTHGGKESAELNPFDIYEFDGGAYTASTGKVKDLNLMLKDGAQGFMKAWDLSGELTIETKPEEIVWIFSYEQDIKITANGEDIKLKPFSLSVLSGFEKKGILNIKTAPVTHGTDKTYSEKPFQKLLFGKICLPAVK